MLHKQFVGLLPGIADARSFAIWDGYSMNGVGILMIQDEDVIVATAGGDVETTSLISIRRWEMVTIYPDVNCYPPY